MMVLYVLYAVLIALLFVVIPVSKATKRPWSIWIILTGFMVLFSIYATEHEGDISYLIASIFLAFLISIIYLVVGIGSDRIRWSRIITRARESREKWMDVGRFCINAYKDNKRALIGRMKISRKWKSIALGWRGHAKHWKRRAIGYREKALDYKDKADIWRKAYDLGIQNLDNKMKREMRGGRKEISAEIRKEVSAEIRKEISAEVPRSKRIAVDKKDKDWKLAFELFDEDEEDWSQTEEWDEWPYEQPPPPGGK